MVLEVGGELSGVFVGDVGGSGLVEVVEGFFGVSGRADFSVGVSGFGGPWRRSPAAG